jgi:hypothetical protein
MLKTPMCRERPEILGHRRTVAGMITMITAFVSLLSFRFRSRAATNTHRDENAIDLYRLGLPTTLTMIARGR